MSSKEDNALETFNDDNASRSEGESDHERTVVQHDEIAELKEDMKSLRMSVERLIGSYGTLPQNKGSSNLPSFTAQQLPTTLAPTTLQFTSPLTTVETTSTLPQISMPISYFNYDYTPQNYMPENKTKTTSMTSQSQPHYTLSHSNTNFPPQDTCTQPQFASFLPSRPAQPCTSSIQSIPQQTLNVLRGTEEQQQVYQPFRKLYDLPEFDGTPEQWPMFAVSYKETTQQYNYTKLENLFRLQKALKGNAKAKVEAYLIHPESVEQVMNTLEFHYGRPHIMIRSQIAKVKLFPAISGRKITEISNFATMVANLTVFLENAGATTHLANPTLVDELVNKLPLTRREEWIKYSLTNLCQYPTVRQFSEWLQNVAMFISLATETDDNNEEAAKSKGGKWKPSFAITVDNRKQIKCVTCHNNHFLNQCTKFKNCPTDERWKLVKDNRLCFSCLAAGHNASQCNKRRQCGISNCLRFHNRLLHENKKGKQNNAIVSDDTFVCDGNQGKKSLAARNGSDSASVTTIVDNRVEKGTLFKYLPVRLKGPNGIIDIMAFIDDGSKVSLLEEEVANKIGLKGSKNSLSLGWIGGRKSNEMSMKLEMEIINDDNCSFHMKNVRTTENLRLPKQSLDLKLFKAKFPILEEIHINEYRNVMPKLLIGLPHVRLVRPHQVINLDDCFSVHKTALGNILFGSNEESLDPSVYLIEVNTLDDIKQQISDYFSIESFGMKALSPVMSDEDLRAEQILSETTVKRGEQYETGLLWKKDNYEFKESYSMAFKRLQGAENKMKRNPELRKWYENKIEEYIQKGYARKLSAKEAKIENDRTWYLPHFVIENINKGNKKRLVFDAAATVNGESFNTRLLKGPEKYHPKPLLSILFGFRQRKVAVCGDIREMFHRVRIRESDQTAQRFLWRSCLDNTPPEIYVMQAMIFGSACSPCSAQFVKNSNAKIFQESDARAYKAIVDFHYVDDYVDSFDSTVEAIAITKKVVNIHSKAGFELRGLISNSPEFCQAFESSNNENNPSKNLSITESLTEKVLGLCWMPKDDSFHFLLRFSRVPEAVLNGSRRPTKSEVLSLVMSIFDPFGFLANIVITSKIILQDLWTHNTEWNEAIPDKIYLNWREWYEELQNARHIMIPRCYDKAFTDRSTTVELHIFVDASEMAFAAVGYWRIVSKDSKKLKFVAGKARCAPIKSLSIPRLELQAAVLGVRLKNAIISSHEVTPKRIIFWSDSKTVVKWIQSDSRIYKQFVAHRVAEILEYSDVTQWQWVPGSQNPADDATRPVYFSGNADDSRWLNGPSFLLSEEDWPKQVWEADKHFYESEMRSKFLCTITDVQPVIPYEKYSTYYKLLRVKCWISRAIKIFKCLAAHENRFALNFNPFLTVQEIKEAEMYWCKLAQRECFGKEYEVLKSGQAVSKKSSIYNLSPYLNDDGLIRISGRINKATCVGERTREPIILPKGHTITKLIVKYFHEKYIHQNQEAICAAIRTKFWIPSLRQLVRSAKKNCQVCKNRSAVPKMPLMGQLPTDRITPYVRPFTYTGIDYLGPYTILIGRRREKRWVALFTCMTTRAVHLELARDLSTDAVILCIKNFMNRRGVPVRIRSDRGTNFVGASREDFVRMETQVAEECTGRGVEWVFNTPANPSAGGAWERMVRSIKNVLAFTLNEKSPQVETLTSLLIEAENLVNSRPLTHLPIESTDSEPLTPNHFLLGSPNIVQTPAVHEKVCLRKQWQILQQLKQVFWRRWVLEYLPDLTRRTKWYQPVKPLQKGDVVVICDEAEERGKWKRGVVEETCTASDGQVRSAVVRTAIGSLRRPASKLAVLDVVSLPDRLTGGGM